jgi:hypothetical protein
MAEYVIEYDNGADLTDKVPLETFSLFTTAEQYLNGAIFQFKRINEAKEKAEKDPKSQELLTLEVHSYLSYINLAYRCFESIKKLNKNDRTITGKSLVKFWSMRGKKKDPKSIFTPFKNARDFVEHINERILDAKDIAECVGAGALYLTCFKDGALIYYPKKEIDEKNKLPEIKYVVKLDRKKLKHYYYYKEDSIPINEVELDKVREVYTKIYEILKSGEPNLQYQEKNKNFITLMRNCVMTNCIGPMEAFVAGAVSNCTFKGCIAFNCEVRKS